MSGIVHTRGKSLWDWFEDVWTYEMTLASAYMLYYLSAIWLQLQMNNISKHHQHVKEVLKCLHKTSLYAKAEKYKFYSELVEYLEYILSSSSLIMSDNKVKII